MKAQRMVCFVVIAFACLAVAGLAGAASVAPVLVGGNPTCVGLGYDFGFKPQPEPPPSGTYTFPDGVNTFTLVTGGGEYQSFDWSSTLGVDAVIVKGGSGAHLYVYDPPAESFGDTGLLSAPNPGGTAAVSHIEVCYDYELAVSKTAATSYVRTFQWDIEKTAVPATWQLFDGDQGTSTWTVSVEKTGYVDSGWTASGQITVENATPFAATITDVSDVISGFGAVAVDCGVSLPYDLPAGGSLACSYSAALPDANGRVNTATVSTAGVVGGGTDTADIVFGAPSVLVNDTVTVSDSNGQGWSTSVTQSWSYTEAFACGGDAGRHDNVATITETGQSDDASVVVSCYDLSVSKTATGTYDREYQWTIVKSAEPASWELFNGDDATSNWTVSVTKGESQDVNWGANGVITIVNNHPSKAAQLVSVADLVSPDLAAAVSCPAMLVGAGQSLDCTYDLDLPNGDSRTNTATVTQQNYAYANGGASEIGTTDYSGQAIVTFGDPTNILLDSIDVTDRNGRSWQTSQSDSWTYPEQFSCGEDAGRQTNTATITQTGDNADASVDIACSALRVIKTAAAEYTRTYVWEIDKTADPESWSLFDGDSGTTDYTVSVTRDDGTDSDFGATGTITVYNLSATLDATLTGVADEVSGGFPAVVSCPALTVPAGGELVCSYTVELDGATDRVNTATATQQNFSYAADGSSAAAGTTDYSDDADVLFGDPTTVVNADVTVTDTNGESWTASDDDSWTYSHTFDCAGVDFTGASGSYTHPNTAEIVETEQTASASVDVVCYLLEVSKDAETSYTRTWDWTVDKTADVTELTLSVGQVYTVGYTVTPGATWSDGDWAVQGDITIRNPNPDRAADLAGVEDEISSMLYASVDCGGATSVPAGGTLTCTYERDLPDAGSRLNTATATLQNYDLAADGSAVAAGTTDFSGEADVAFGDPSTLVDDCIELTDTHVDDWGEGSPSRQVCFGDLPTAFQYAVDVSYDTCGAYLVTNTAAFTTDDSGAAGSDVVEIPVEVPCYDGCTLTPGYWKTHSDYGPAPYDETWAILCHEGVCGPDTPFFLSGQSYYDVLWTSPQGGNAYYILAHAWIAAELNGLNGASLPPGDVADAFYDSVALFEDYTPDDVAEFKGKNGKETRALFILNAMILDEYNNGFQGVPHCSEDSSSVN